MVTGGARRGGGRELAPLLSTEKKTEETKYEGGQKPSDASQAKQWNDTDDWRLAGRRHEVSGWRVQPDSSMLDIAPLDLDALGAETAEWLTPFTSQAEKGDWDWDGAWYDCE